MGEKKISLLFKMLPSILKPLSGSVDRGRVMSLWIVNLIAHCGNIVT